MSNLKSPSDYHCYTPELIERLKQAADGVTRAEGVKAVEKILGVSDRQARRAFAKYVEGIDPQHRSTEVDGTFKRSVWFIEPYYTLEIDNDGVRIRSSSKHAKGRELSIYLNPFGYPKVKINNNGVLIHHLVAHVCLGPRPEGLVINHKDGVKTNNQPENLEYVTIKENIHHAIEHGLHVASDPTRMPTYKDGRSMGDKKKGYKRAWYEANRERILAREKQRYQDKKNSKST